MEYKTFLCYLINLKMTVYTLAETRCNETLRHIDYLGLISNLMHKFLFIHI
jgi:hypothetical protein